MPDGRPESGSRSRRRIVVRRLFIPTALAMLVHVLSPPTADAQERVSMTVDGFNGFRWGAPASEIFESLGEPARTDTLDGGMLVVAYRDSLEQFASVAMYAILADEGLVKGQHSIPFDELTNAGECEAGFIRLRNYLLLKYPMIVPEDRSRNDSSKAFCEGVLDGDAAWISTWTDSATGARAMVVIDAGQPRLNVVFESARFLEWVEQREAGTAPGN